MKKKDNECSPLTSSKLILLNEDYLEEIIEKQDLQLQQNAWILAKLTELDDKISHTRIDAVIARRERCW